MGRTRYGFTWGPMVVERIAISGNGMHALGVRTESNEIEVYVSKGGRKIHVFRDGKELK